MHRQIVPVILTFNESPNIGRVLSKLAWAGSVLVLDSYSDDTTEKIAKSFKNVEFHQRSFDSAANQWNTAVSLAARRGSWILALDADYLLSDDLVAEMGGLSPDPGTAGYESQFVYCIDGLPLKASLYPSHTVLFRADRGHYIQDGHTQRLALSGSVERLVHPIYHDDRKPWGRWYQNQIRYARQEADKVRVSSWSSLSLSGKARRLPPLSMFLPPVYLLIYKGLWRDGVRGLKYVWQRFVAEWLIQKELWFRMTG